MKWEGISGFYSGIYSPLLGQMIFRACSFSIFHYTSRSLIDNKTNKTMIVPYFIAGGMTGLAISFIETPIDLLKTKLQTQIFLARLDPNYKAQYRNVYECINFIRNKYGLKALWQGFSATMIRNIPANALFFPVNELVKRKFASNQGINVSELHLSYKLMSGACAGLCYWVLTYPLDAIKGQAQAFPYETRKSFTDTAKYIYSVNGINGFFRGIAPCAARSIPACAAMFATVDICRESLVVLLEN